MMKEAPRGGICRTVWVVALLITVLPSAFAKALEKCATYQLDVKVEICSEIRGRAKVGETIRWTISIPSTDKPMALRLRNATPVVAQLRRRCADGIVRTSGGERNNASCKVKIIGLGTARLDAWPYLEDPRKRADFTASRIVGDLARCELDYQTHRESLEAMQHEHVGRRVYSSDNVEAVLRQGERCALSALGGLPELVAMADWFEKVFGDARQELTSISTRAFLPSVDDSRLVFSVLNPKTVRSRAVLAHAGEMHVDADKTNRILDLLDRLLSLATIKAAEKKLWIRELFVMSCDEKEKGALFTLYPWSYVRDSQTTTIDGTVVNLYLGIYAYKLEKKDKKKGCYPEHEEHDSCARINLMSNPEALRCDFENGCETRNNKLDLKNCER